MEPIPPCLQINQKEHIFVVQDESIFHANDQKRELWLQKGQQPLRQKGNGRAIHVSDFVTERSETGRLCLSSSQLAAHNRLPEASQLKQTNARKIIYPGKNHDKWWDMEQLKEQTLSALLIFEYLFPHAVGVFVFDCSSSHEAFAKDALNVNKMNVNPGGKQVHMHDTVIPPGNPPPKPGSIDTRGRPQSMVFPVDHPDPKLRGQAKGMLEVLRERTSVWEIFVEKLAGKKVVGICGACKTSQKKKDALRKLLEAEQAGQEELLSEDDIRAAEEAAVDDEQPVSSWCCAKRVLSLQQDFLEEKPELQLIIEERGHICLFLPKFHCEFSAIEMYWGFGKHREPPFFCLNHTHTLTLYYTGYREASDGKFTTARELVPQCLDLCDVFTIRRFFRKCWRYMDSYR